jgi:hypothetical protein
VDNNNANSQQPADPSPMDYTEVSSISPTSASDHFGYRSLNNQSRKKSGLESSNRRYVCKTKHSKPMEID